MSVTRRSFLQTATCVSAGLAVGGATPTRLFAAERANSLTPYLTGMEMASTPATLYRAYRSKPVAEPETSTWVQIDLGTRAAIDAIRLFPASERMYPGRDQYYSGEGFPLRFRIEASDDAGFGRSSIIADLTRMDFPDPVGNITQYDAHGARGRYVRLTATHLRPVKVGVKGQPRDVLADSKEFTLTLAKVSVLSAGRDIATGCTVTADAVYGNPDLTQQLTRQAREDGEQIYMDRGHLVTDPSTWKRVAFQAEAPRSGVTLEGGIFETTMRNNIAYLLNSYSTSELLRQFYERTGKVTNFKPTGTQVFWEEDLAGSNAGRFLMGAGNTIRWIDDPALRRRLNEVVDGIEECRESNGYIMAYPADTIFYSERAAYTRAWLTHGLLEAAYAGNAKALPMLRGYYDWF
ncbi:MAG TPA: beta-L-arabinofuranosidase domain-containing protein, partial [Terriglobia bacterium]|nr:beta-L-arabinofuranosidase domain-containing protein [Terriglobia bacterium]